jgi:hypothetical protein
LNNRIYVEKSFENVHKSIKTNVRIYTKFDE